MEALYANYGNENILIAHYSLTKQTDGSMAIIAVIISKLPSISATSA